MSPIALSILPIIDSGEKREARGECVKCERRADKEKGKRRRGRGVDERSEGVESEEQEARATEAREWRDESGGERS
ncbi:hypothetical protein Tco_0925106 [Tanacetum coccineum]|uniref:Uncharacterized protein n=1 Tax=Tanacetum coccineum TaxID=301880 RepID=A0ABQ5D797_9ASTR